MAFFGSMGQRHQRNRGPQSFYGMGAQAPAQQAQPQQRPYQMAQPPHMARQENMRAPVQQQGMQAQVMPQMANTGMQVSGPGMSPQSYRPGMQAPVKQEPAMSQQMMQNPMIARLMQQHPQFMRRFQQMPQFASRFGGY